MMKQLKENEENENPFAMSIGDLMAGLLFIFILLLTATMLKIQKQSDREAKITNDYNKVKTQLYIDLQEEFKDSLKVWNAIIDSTELSVRFQEPSTLFDYNKSALKPRFKAILNDFFPRYIALINQPKYKKNIEEIRIEGHTDTSGEYFSNMKLSQDRTRSVLQYCLYLLPQNQQNWAMQRITANGLSSSHIILRKGKEDPRLSRRVEFRIRTNAEEKLEEIAKRRHE
jgi:outer membrane protein OmpA-like peptidoglycan-associated protein